MRLVQHKKEAFWFYRFLSIFYDDYVNPFFWTERMRNESLELAELDTPNLKVVDVGSGTGFTTQGIVKQIATTNVSCVDQSPHQMARAKKKADLKGCHFQLGDAEDLNFPTDHFDRYVSAGSIEYWPEPQRGIAEAYRVLKPGGVALMIGPLQPDNWLGRVIANLWMLFPSEREYHKWFKDAGFTDIKKKYVAPDWVKNEKYGIAISGSKPSPGASPINQNGKLEKPGDRLSILRGIKFFFRLIIGSLAGFLFIPMAVMGNLRKFFADRFFAKEELTQEDTDPFTPQQIFVLLVLVTMAILGLSYLILS